MEGDAKALLEVAVSVFVSMTYARFVSSSIPSGKLRLLSLLPVVVFLPLLPWRLSSIHLRGIAAFFLGWLGVFKLLLLSFGLGPLSPSLPLHTFLAVSSLPVKLRPSSPSPSPSPSKSNSFFRLFLPTLIRTILLLLIIPIYEYKLLLHPYLLIGIYCVHMYLMLEIVLACVGFVVLFLLGLDLEPHFNAPYRSTSLQDFWGRRWNLVVTGILRPSVYHPVSSRWGQAAGVMATFLVSGLMHEVMFWYLTLAAPSGEATAFFVLHGACTAAETAARRKGWWRLSDAPVVVAAPLTVGFVAGTGCWLFFPPVLRHGSDKVVLEESAAMARFLGSGGRALLDLMGGVRW